MKISWPELFPIILLYLFQNLFHMNLIKIGVNYSKQNNWHQMNCLIHVSVSSALTVFDRTSIESKLLELRNWSSAWHTLPR